MIVIFGDENENDLFVMISMDKQVFFLSKFNIYNVFHAVTISELKVICSPVFNLLGRLIRLYKQFHKVKVSLFNILLFVGSLFFFPPMSVINLLTSIPFDAVVFESVVIF